jgi:hypothetical protein
VARALTADEQSRYPWATRIDDFVPVGRVRKVAVLCSAVGLGLVLVGMIISLALAQSIHGAVTMHHAPTAAGIYAGMALTGAGAIVSIVMALQALPKKAYGLLWWAVAAVVPALIVFFILWPAARK